jgi:hypothetical protein
MKLRVPFQLRFRNAEQFTQVKRLAGDVGMNEWLLRQIEEVLERYEKEPRESKTGTTKGTVRK